MHDFSKLSQLGWRTHFQQQLSLQELETQQAYRVIAQHRSGYQLAGVSGEYHLAIGHSMPLITVGDWLLLNNDMSFYRLLKRTSLFSRKAPGSKLDTQLIAANVDTAFIVCSLNYDFNLGRIERYLSLVNQANVEPVLVLSKLDVCTDPDIYIDQLKQLNSNLIIEQVNGLDASSTSVLQPWCKDGQTVVFIGSSGVGKSTLANTLANSETFATGGIREDDSKGRHTTTSRALKQIALGGLLLDTPGMRELQLTDCEHGVSSTFDDIQKLEQQCRFNNCQHQNQPGCAVTAAIEAGELEPRRLLNYQKLLREQANNTASLAEKRAHFKSQTKMYRNIQTESRKRKKNN
ncbi:ribosome small subunit-dependent GTPase A [Pelagibaculum spongiae]|uniref:Small ribosomal subunit biogenesis GTPase RsgA n=1 Tax=Pelagibaculum spongiae TaxID=2080658 RepID=A0A2V1GZF2_9GAMM|nr:ribosome small subunit-dependent GTPase A [Pelagibaculum spongiae]PVZ68375.1 ribosome small subunit-dependent GTPase A [Pelagibaculum spongiae]